MLVCDDTADVLDDVPEQPWITENMSGNAQIKINLTVIILLPRAPILSFDTKPLPFIHEATVEETHCNGF